MRCTDELSTHQQNKNSNSYTRDSVSRLINFNAERNISWTVNQEGVTND